jgi:hypothetical protein
LGISCLLFPFPLGHNAPTSLKSDLNKTVPHHFAFTSCVVLFYPTFVPSHFRHCFAFQFPLFLNQSQAKVLINTPYFQNTFLIKNSPKTIRKKKQRVETNNPKTTPKLEYIPNNNGPNP